MYKICTLLSSFGKKMYGPKVLNILPFRFFRSFLFSRFSIIPYKLFLYYLVKKESIILRSLNCFNPYFILQKYKHKHCKEIEAMVHKTDSKLLNG